MKASSDTATTQIETKDVTVGLRQGAVVAITNRLTSESYLMANSSEVYARVHSTANKLPSSQAPGECSVNRQGSVATLRSIWSDGSKASTVCEVDPKSGEVMITQQASTPSGGVYGVSWELGDVPDSMSILVPGDSGQCLGAESAFETRSFDYPMQWEAPYVVILGSKGGVVIRAEDTKYQFKTLHVEHRPGFFRLRFESRNQAPFDKLNSVKSVNWKITAFRGPWQVGAAIYNNWAAKAYKMVSLERKSAAWAKDIQFIVTMDTNVDLLQPLAKQVNPRQTILYLPGWRKDGYDRNYPTYEAIDGFELFVQAAHKFGFRVMPHCNYFGCDPLNPLFAQFEKYQIRDAFTKEPQWWIWKAEPIIKFAYINPASKAWRKLLVSRLVELVKRYKVDALYIDQTLCIYNDGAGLVDGMNCIQGNIALIRELTQALPNVPVGGEGLNEVTCLYESFAQRHELSIDFTAGTWDTKKLDQAHPISSSLLLQYTRMYGYLGMPNPNNNPGLFTAWRTGYERYGIIPTLPWPSIDQLEKPSGLVAQVFDEARFYQKYKPTADFSPTWGKSDRFVYKLSDGRRAAYRQDTGSSFQVDAPGGSQTLWRRITGVSELPTTGSIPSWYAYDEKKIIGLDPVQTYYWSPKPRDMKALHIASLPSQELTLAGIGVHEQFARFQMKYAKETIRLMDCARQAQSGVKLYNGLVKHYPGVGFSDECGGAMIQSGSALYMHPPWKPSKGGPQTTKAGTGYGDTFVTYNLELPAAKSIIIEAMVNLRAGQDPGSDGVLFRIEASAGGKRLSAETFDDTTVPKPLRLDISSLSGQKVELTLTLNPGPAGNFTCDGAMVNDPVIKVTAEMAGAVEVVCPQAVKHLLSASGQSKLTRVSVDRYRIESTFPNTITMVYSDPLAITGDTNLLTTPYMACQRSSTGMESPPGGWSSVGVGEVSCLNVPKQSLSAHPPADGKTIVDYWLNVPSGKARVIGYVGLRDGSKSTGVAFEVWVNGQPVVRKVAVPDDGWLPIEVDISRYSGAPVMLSLVTDPNGFADYDWAVWGDIRLQTVWK